MSRLKDLRKKYSQDANYLETLRYKYNGGDPSVTYDPDRPDVGGQPEPWAPDPTVAYDPDRPDVGTYAVKPVTNEDVSYRLESDMKSYRSKLRGLERQLKQPNYQYGSVPVSKGMDPLEYSYRKLALLKQQPSKEEVQKNLNAERAMRQINHNPTDQNAWLTYAANTMNTLDLQKFQTDRAYQKMVKSGHLPEIQSKATLANLTDAFRDQYADHPKAGSALQSLKDWWLRTKGSVDTLSGFLAPAVGGILANQSPIQKEMAGVEDYDTSPEMMQKAQDKAFSTGWEKMQEAGRNREAVTGGDWLNKLIYDVVGVVPDMAATAALAAVTGGAGLIATEGAELSTTALFKQLFSKKALAPTMKALATKLIVSPDTVPLGAKIFSESFQQLAHEGMDKNKAVLTAFANAYGQSLLEAGGINLYLKRVVRQGLRA